MQFVYPIGIVVEERVPANGLSALNYVYFNIAVQGVDKKIAVAIQMEGGIVPSEVDVPCAVPVKVNGKNALGVNNLHGVFISGWSRRSVIILLQENTNNRTKGTSSRFMG